MGFIWALLHLISQVGLRESSPWTSDVSPRSDLDPRARRAIWTQGPVGLNGALVRTSRVEGKGSDWLSERRFIRGVEVAGGGEAPKGRGNGCQLWLVRQLSGEGSVTSWSLDWHGRHGLLFTATGMNAEATLYLGEVYFDSNEGQYWTEVYWLVIGVVV